MARVPYVAPEDLPAEYRHVFDRLAESRGYVPNLYRAMANSPHLVEPFVRMMETTRAEAALPNQLKELAVLRVAQLTGAATMWASHETLARDAGVPGAKLRALAVWRSHAIFTSEESAALSYAEAATRDVRVDDATWEDVRSHFTHEQQTELVIAVAFYNMVARISEPLALELDLRYLDTEAD